MATEEMSLGCYLKSVRLQKVWLKSFYWMKLKGNRWGGPADRSNQPSTQTLTCKSKNVLAFGLKVKLKLEQVVSWKRQKKMPGFEKSQRAGPQAGW